MARSTRWPRGWPRERRAVLDPALIEGGRRAARGKDVKAMIEADIAFHSAIYDASGNPLIGESARPHWRHLRRVMGAVLQIGAAARGDLGRARGDRRGDRRGRRRARRPAHRPAASHASDSLRTRLAAVHRRRRTFPERTAHETHRRTTRTVRPRRLPVLPRQFTRRGNEDPDRRRARAVQPARGLQRAREGQGRGPHQLRGAHVQRALRPAGAASAHGRAGEGPLRRGALHAPVQDQRQDGLRRRRLAVAPGLRHLAQRRHDADRARDERRHLPGRRQRATTAR